MEESGFEPLNPKERIYSPSRLATSLLLQKVFLKPDNSYNTEKDNKLQEQKVNFSRNYSCKFHWRIIISIAASKLLLEPRSSSPKKL